jgi:5-methylcytosine-specific restriction endonuclease McrA
VTRVRSRRPTPRRRDAPREGAEWWEWATTVLYIRSRGFCEFCCDPLTEPVERHHRLRRRDGGDRLANLLILHQRCHQFVTEHPHMETPAGRIVRTGHDPATVPVWIDGDWWLLDDQGGKTPTEAPCP